jgi:hypothetical protein
LEGTKLSTTRTEIVEHVEDAFGAGGADRAELVAAAERNAAPQRVLDLLRRLPDRRYRHVRDLWAEVPEVPVGA